MSALSAVLLIFSFQFSLLSPRQSARQHSGVLVYPISVGHRTLPNIWVGFLYGAYIPKE